MQLRVSSEAIVAVNTPAILRPGMTPSSPVKNSITACILVSVWQNFLSQPVGPLAASQNLPTEYAGCGPTSEFFLASRKRRGAGWSVDQLLDWDCCHSHIDDALVVLHYATSRSGSSEVKSRLHNCPWTHV